jgi:hypothetical protein
MIFCSTKNSASKGLKKPSPYYTKIKRKDNKKVLKQLIEGQKQVSPMLSKSKSRW